MCNRLTKIASKVQYNKREINLSNITSCKILSYLPVLIFQFLYVLRFKSIIVPFTKPGLILHIQVIVLDSVSWLKLKIKYANVIIGAISVTKIARRCCYSISWYNNSKHNWAVLKFSPTYLVATIMLQSGDALILKTRASIISREVILSM